jgi:hypothetical protein
MEKFVCKVNSPFRHSPSSLVRFKIDGIPHSANTAASHTGCVVNIEIVRPIVEIEQVVQVIGANLKVEFVCVRVASSCQYSGFETHELGGLFFIVVRQVKEPLH